MVTHKKMYTAGLNRRAACIAANYKKNTKSCILAKKKGLLYSESNHDKQSAI